MFSLTVRLVIIFQLCAFSLSPPSLRPTHADGLRKSTALRTGFLRGVRQRQKQSKCDGIREGAAGAASLVVAAWAAGARPAVLPWPVRSVAAAAPSCPSERGAVGPADLALLRHKLRVSLWSV